MINLIDKNLYNYQFAWGNGGGDGLWVNTPANIYWDKDMVILSVKKESIPGWYMTDKWERVDMIGKYSTSLIVTKDQYFHGTYVLRCFLPRYRGTWPAFWFLDTSLSIYQGGDGMGIPPEIDVMEYMRKRGFWRRWMTTHTYHDRPPDGKYGKMICKSMYDWRPVDNREMEFVFEWYPTYMRWIVNGTRVMDIKPSDVNKFPDHPMNIVLNHAVGPWSIRDDKISPFIVHEFQKQ